MSHKADEDMRTCAACSAPVAPEFRGYLGSIRACERHVAAWRASPERMKAMLTHMQDGRGTTEAFGAWAARVAGGAV